MTWTGAGTPHEGGCDAGDACSSAGGWRAEPLPPGALGAAPRSSAMEDDEGGPFADLSPLPLTGTLAEALATARAGADAAAKAACYLASVGPEQRVQALAQASRARDVLEATLLRLTATFTPEELRALGATSLTDVLLTHTGASPQRASTEVKLAAAVTAPPLTAPTPTAEADDDCDADPVADTGAFGPAAGTSQVNLARLGAAHARGDISTDITALAVRTVADLPARIRRTHMATADATLTRLLPGKTHEQAAIVCSALAHRLDPDRADRGFDPDDIDRRYLNHTTHADGFVDVRARLDPVTGAEFRAAIDHLSKPDPTVTAPLADQQPLPGLDDADAEDPYDQGSDQGSGVPVRDERTAGQRRADALALLVRTGRASDRTRGGEGARVIVTTTDAALRGGPGAEPAHCETTNRPLSTAALRTTACAGSLQAVVLSCTGADAEVLSLGRAVRLFTAGQRRAMLARDGGCVIPGCTAPPGWLEAHHVHEWAAGGPTDVSHGVLLCTRHHVLVTLGTWAVRMVAGAPQVRPPRSVDPLRRWVLSPRRSLREATARAVQQLLREPVDDWHDDPAGTRVAEPPGAPDIPSAHSTCPC